MGFKKKAAPPPYDPDREEPVLRSSICTGETAAGFLDRGTGRFREVMLVRSEKDVRRFCKEYRVAGYPRRIV